MEIEKKQTKNTGIRIKTTRVKEPLLGNPGEVMISPNNRKG
jgi:hypothetical protein